MKPALKNMPQMALQTQNQQPRVPAMLKRGAVAETAVNSSASIRVTNAKPTTPRSRYAQTMGSGGSVAQ